MKDSIFFMILLQVILIALNAIFACAEIAVISMNDNKLAKLASQKDKRAVALMRLTSQPARFLATIQVAITLSGFLGSAFAAENFSGVIVDWLIALGVTIPANILDSVSVIFITIILSYFTLVFGELLPKQVAMRNAETLALGLSGLISKISVIFSPLVSFLTFSTNAVLRLFGINPDVEEENVSEEEIRMMVDVGSEKGTIDVEEKEFIQNVFEFDDLSAEDIITHRTEVVMLDLNDSIETWDNTIVSSKYTYYPICDGSADNVVGLLNTKTYFRLNNKDRDSVMKNAIVQPYFVLETTRADVLFQNMKKNHCSFAVVLDEYGGMSGILTIKDLVEQLVGDLGNDNQKEQEVEIECIDEGVWRISGNTLLEDVEKELHVPLACEDYDTLSGLVFHMLGNIPEDGTDIEVDIDKINVKVTEIHNHKVKTAIVTLKKN